MNFQSNLLFLALFTVIRNVGLFAQDPTIASNHLSSELSQISVAFIQGDKWKARNILVDLIVGSKPQQHGDSTLGEMALANINRVSRDLSLQDRLSYLRLFQPLFSNSLLSSPQDQAGWYHLQAICYQRLSQTDTMDIFIDSMDALVNQFTEPSLLAVSLCYIRARSAYLKNDFQASLDYLEEGLEYVEKYFPKNIVNKRLILNGIGIGYRRINQQVQAIDHHHKTLAFLRRSSSNPYWEANVLNNVGLCYQDLMQYDSAAFYMKKAISGYEKLGDLYHDNISTGLANLAQVYRLRNFPDTALAYADASIRFMKKAFGDDHPDLLLPEYIIAEIYFKQQKLAEALVSNEKAFSRLKSLGWSKEDPQGNYFLSDALATLATNIEVKSAIYRQEPDAAMLDSAISSGEEFLLTVDYAYDNLKSQVAKEVFQKKYRRIFSLAIDNLYEKYSQTQDAHFVNRALNWSEKYKSLELLFAARKDRIQQNSEFGILISKYKRLQQNITTALMKEVKEIGDQDEDVSVSYESDLRKAQQDLHIWKGEIQRDHPQYYQMIFHPDDIDVGEVQRDYLDPNKTLVSYHLAEDHIFAFVINKNNLDLKRIELDVELSDQITRLRKAVYTYFVENHEDEGIYNSSLDAYFDAAYVIYDQLVKPIKSDLADRIVIIPDQVLAYLPFDLLTSEKPDSRQQLKFIPYLLREHAISYAYSVPLWVEMHSQPQVQNHSLLSFAPDYQTDDLSFSKDIFAMRSSLKPLLYNELEVGLVAEDWEAEIWTGDDGTKRNFLDRVEHFGLIHLAMHAKANDRDGDFSYLAFSNTGVADFRLYASEIYGLDLSAELVILSACESGIGELQIGEGLISLARAFSFAGARSLVSTSWAVNDASTPKIMELFYKQLRMGKPKDEALQQAKITYIREVDHSNAHPFFWAGFSIFGDMKPISEAEDLSIWFSIGLISALLLVAGFALLRHSS